MSEPLPRTLTQSPSAQSPTSRKSTAVAAPHNSGVPGSERRAGGSVEANGIRASSVGQEEEREAPEGGGSGGPDSTPASTTSSSLLQATGAPSERAAASTGAHAPRTNIKRVLWSPAEEALLASAVEAHGHAWRSVANALEAAGHSRSEAAVATHWVVMQDRNAEGVPSYNPREPRHWTETEDVRLLALHELCHISAAALRETKSSIDWGIATQRFPGRSRTDLKHRLGELRTKRAKENGKSKAREEKGDKVRLEMGRIKAESDEGTLKEENGEHSGAQQVAPTTGAAAAEAKAASSSVTPVPAPFLTQPNPVGYAYPPGWPNLSNYPYPSHPFACAYQYTNSCAYPYHPAPPHAPAPAFSLSAPPTQPDPQPEPKRTKKRSHPHPHPRALCSRSRAGFEAGEGLLKRVRAVLEAGPALERDGGGASGGGEGEG